MMNILAVARTQWIEMTYRERGMLRVGRGKGYYIWQKPSTEIREYVQVWWTDRPFSAFFFPRNPILSPKMVRLHLSYLLLHLVWVTKLLISLTKLPTKDWRMKWPLLGSPENASPSRSSALRQTTFSLCFSSCRREEVSSILLFQMLPLPHYCSLSFKLMYSTAGTANANNCQPSPLPPWALLCPE